MLTTRCCYSHPWVIQYLAYPASVQPLIWLGTRHQLAKQTITQLKLTTSTVEFDSEANDLGVVLDSQLSMASHIAATCRSCIYQMRQLRSIRRSLTTDSMHALV